MSNAADSIKIACDFLPVENLKQTLQVASELRLQRLCTGHGQDVLQLLPTVYYTILALRELQSKVFTGRLRSDNYSPSMTADNLLTTRLSHDSSMQHSAHTDISATSNSNDDDAYTTPTPVNYLNGPTTVHPKTLRKREKNRIKRLTRATEACPYKGPSLGLEFRFACPLCPRAFIRCGIIDHL